MSFPDTLFRDETGRGVATLAREVSRGSARLDENADIDHVFGSAWSIRLERAERDPSAPNRSDRARPCLAVNNVSGLRS
jgi:hypothetical protein